MLVIFNAPRLLVRRAGARALSRHHRRLQRVQQGDLAFRLPPLRGFEACAIGAAFNRMAQAVQDKVQAEKKAHEAETRLDERARDGIAR